MEYIFVKYPGFRSMANDSNTKLLLHMNGANDSTTIIDSGATGHSPTAGGNAKLKTAQKKFGTASCYFDDSPNYIAIPAHADWYFAAAAFTIDMWVRFAADNNENGLAGQYIDGDTYIYFYQRGSADLLIYEWDDNGSSESFSTDWAPSLDTWYHVAFIRGWGGNVNSWAMCVDGIALETWSNAATQLNLATEYRVGENGNTGGIEGYIDEFRISKGVARWTTDFIVPAGPYPG